MTTDERIETAQWQTIIEQAVAEQRERDAALVEDGVLHSLVCECCYCQQTKRDAAKIRENNYGSGLAN